MGRTWYKILENPGQYLVFHFLIFAYFRIVSRKIKEFRSPEVSTSLAKRRALLPMYKIRLKNQIQASHSPLSVQSL